MELIQLAHESRQRKDLKVIPTNVINRHMTNSEPMKALLVIYACGSRAVSEILFPFSFQTYPTFFPLLSPSIGTRTPQKR